MSSKGATTLKIRDFQWFQLIQLLNSAKNQLIESISESNQNDFLLRWVFQNERKFDDVANKFWISQYILHLATQLNLSERTSFIETEGYMLEQNLDKFKKASRAALVQVIFDQTKLSKSKAQKNKTVEVSTFLSIDFGPAGENFPFILGIMFASLLGFHSMPSSESWMHAGLSYNMRLFCMNLFEKKYAEYFSHLNPISPPVQDEEETTLNKEREADKCDPSGNALSWKSSWAEARLLKCCILFVWAQKLQETKTFLKTDMLTTWIPHACKLYADSVHFWVSAKIKAWPSTLITGIEYTVGNSWFDEVTHLARFNPKGEIPTFLDEEGNQIARDWRKDILNTVERDLWMGYWAHIITQIKTTPLKTSRIHTVGISDSSETRKNKRASLNVDTNPSKKNSVTRQEEENRSPDSDIGGFLKSAFDNEDDEFDPSMNKMLEEAKKDQRIMMESVEKLSGRVDHLTTAIDRFSSGIDQLNTLLKSFQPNPVPFTGQQISQGPVLHQFYSSPPPSNFSTVLGGSGGGGVGSSGGSVSMQRITY